MSDYLRERIQEFSPQDENQFENALKQILQEVALLGLQRGGFFEKAAFYGGTALRLLYGLPRFSEDLDFSLLKPESNFDLSGYFRALETELSSYGLQTRIEKKKKTKNSVVDSAFIKAETQLHLIKIAAPERVLDRFQKAQLIQIKFEVDTYPALNFETEVRSLLNPTSFEIVSMGIPDLFAGKMHAVLFRAWKNRVKGRDFYDLIWYLKNSHPLSLRYLREKMIQGRVWDPKTPLEREDLIRLFRGRIKSVDFDQAKTDVLPFIQDVDSLKIWKEGFFSQVIEQLRTI